MFIVVKTKKKCFKKKTFYFILNEVQLVAKNGIFALVGLIGGYLTFGRAKPN